MLARDACGACATWMAVVSGRGSLNEPYHEEFDYCLNDLLGPKPIMGGRGYRDHEEFDDCVDDLLRPRLICNSIGLPYACDPKSELIATGPEDHELLKTFANARRYEDPSKSKNWEAYKRWFKGLSKSEKWEAYRRLVEAPSTTPVGNA